MPKADVEAPAQHLSKLQTYLERKLRVLPESVGRLESFHLFRKSAFGQKRCFAVTFQNDD